MVDDIIIPLRIISMIKEGQKVSIHNGLLTIDTNSKGFLSAVKRWFNNDNRIATVYYVKNIVDNALHVKDARVFESLSYALNGINALTVTYSCDFTTVAKLKVIEEKIKEHLRTNNIYETVFPG